MDRPPPPPGGRWRLTGPQCRLGGRNARRGPSAASSSRPSPRYVHKVEREPVPHAFFPRRQYGPFALCTGTGISWAGFKCQSCITATAYTVVGVVNKMVTVLANVLIWDQHASGVGIASLLLCLVGGALYQQACHALARVGAPRVPLATRFRPHQAPLRPPSDADPCSPRHSKSAEDEEEGRSEHELIPLKNGAGSPNKNGVSA